MMMFSIHDHYYFLLPVRRIYYYLFFWWSTIILVINLKITVVNCISRAYPLGCSREDTTYYDYDNYPFPPPGVPVKSTNDYNILERLGNGKFSDVFSAIEVGDDDDGERGRGSSLLDDDDDHDVINPNDLVVIKCLKPVTDRKIRRELLVLSHASKLPNLARLKAIVLHPEFYNSQRSPRMLPRMPSFVLQHAGINTQFLCHPLTTTTTSAAAAANKNHHHQHQQHQHTNSNSNDYLSEYEIKYFLYHLLVALDALHSRGMMHRDVKPRNILITRQRQKTTTTKSSENDEDQHDEFDDDDNNNNNNNDIRSSSSPYSSSSSSSSLMLIDLGLADFYLPNTRYNVRVASRHYKAPELLVGYPYYNFSVDLWPVGCILAGTLFRREPFFRGKDNDDQLAKIIAVLGTKDLISYIHRIRLLETTTTTTSGVSSLSPTIRKLIQQDVDNNNSSNAQSSSSSSSSDIVGGDHATQQLGPQQQQQPSSSTSTLGAGGTGRVPWMSFLRAGCPIPSGDALDLLDKLLVYDHDARLTAEEAMAHPFFDDVRDRIIREMEAWQRQQQQKQKPHQH